MLTSATDRIVSEIPELARMSTEEQRRVLSLCWMSESVQTSWQRYWSRPAQLPFVVVGPLIAVCVYAKISFWMTMLLIAPVWLIGFMVLRRSFHKRLLSALRVTVTSYLYAGVEPRKTQRDLAGKAPPSLRVYVIWIAVLAIIPLVMVFRSKEQPRDDAEMTVAIAKARSTLPQFWEVFDRRGRGESEFALKVRITDGSGTEHFWANDIGRTNGRTMGTINNDPNIVKRVKLGDRIEIPEADISDWMYLRDGQMVGNHTLKALFKKMPASEVESYKRKMTEP
jgi:uncharacterized protein YegJ (DUF2314 family)